MSGVAALYHRDGRPIDPTAVWAMLDAVPDRGPDGMRVWHAETVGLGHAKLTITAEEVDEHQPLVSPRTGCVITADVRLDNRATLIAQLPDRPASTVSDAALILRAYETWGDRAVERLIGDFAFVIWDPRARRMLCARDTSGQRTLFYRVDQHGFAAASEIHQLLQDPATPLAPNHRHIRNFLIPFNMTSGESDGESTFYEGIRGVPAGHLLHVSTQDVQLRRYWSLEPSTEIRHKTMADYAQHFLAVFSQVVQDRLRTIHPVGATLSGGMDSSSVVCVAQDLLRAGRADELDFSTFSLTYEGLECDETPFIQDVQRKYGFRAHFLPAAGRSKWLQLKPPGFRDWPTSATTEFDSLLRMASGKSVRTLLTGDVADSCVTGSPLVFDSLIRHGEWAMLRDRFATYRRNTDEPLRTTLALHCIAPLLPLALQRRVMAAYVQRRVFRDRRRYVPSWIPQPLHDDLYHGHLATAVGAQRERRFSSPARQAEAGALYPTELTRSTAPWPLQIARPFADRRLHEFLLAIPPEVKFAPHPESNLFYAASKLLVREAMRGILPESIRDRRVKPTFNAMFRSEVEREWTDYDAAFGPSAQSRVAAHGYIDQAAFWARLNGVRAGEYRSDIIYVTRMAALESWLRALELPRSQAVSVRSSSTITGDRSRVSSTPHALPSRAAFAQRAA